MLSAFANFRFLKANSAFGLISMVCSILVVCLALAVIGLSTWKTRLIATLKQEMYGLEKKPSDLEKPTKNLHKSFQRSIRHRPELANWEFLGENMSPNLMGFWMYFFVFLMLKEMLTIFFIITFIGTPTL